MVPVVRFPRARSWSLLCLAFLLSLPLSLATPLPAFAQPLPGGQAVVITTEGDRLTVRAGAGRQFAVVGSLAEGTVVAVLDGPQVSADGIAWLKIQGSGITGWASAEWLGDVGTAPAAAPAAAPAPTPAPATAPTPDSGSTINNGGDDPRVTGTGGRGARLRAEPSVSAVVLIVVPEGAEVAVIGASRTAGGYEWVPVRYTGIDGWIASSLLGANVTTPKPPATPAAPTVAPSVAPTPVPTTPTPVPAAPAAPPAAPADGLVPGDSAQVVNTDGYVLRVRARPGLDAPIVSFVPAGAVVTITQAAQADATGVPWYGIDYTGITGWVLGEHLARTGVAPATVPSAAPTARPSASPSATPRTSPTPTPSPAAQPISVPPAGDRGQTIIAVAQKYLGAPYVYGGTTPAGWDCSGFVGYIYKEAAGLSLPRSAAQQYQVGTPIAVGQEQPGDMVFFADTFGPGITHNGIALGGGQFIHARSEGYGTTISNLTDAYWSQHYVGARRP